jgi:hypothetical protein
MASTVQLKRSALSGKVPDTASLALGELAINTYDGKIYFKKSGSVESIQSIITTNAVTTGSITLLGTGSFSLVSGIIEATNGVVSGSSQIISILNPLNSFTQSYFTDSASFDARIIAATNEGQFALTGSNQFIGSQSITGSLRVTETGSFGSLQVNDTLTVSHGISVISGSLGVTSDLTVLGAINARQFNINVISSSTIYESGSSNFGNTSDDIHSFTGSVEITGSFLLNGQEVGGGTTTGSFTGSFTGDGSGLRGVVSDDLPIDGWDYNSNSSASINDFNVTSSKYLIDFQWNEEMGTPIGHKTFISNVSGSTQVVPTDSGVKFIVGNNLVATIDSNGIQSSAAAGTISGSSQLTSSFDQRYTLSGSIPNIPTGSFATTGSNTFNGNETISGSLFISGTTELGGNIVPKTARGATLGTSDRPFSDIFVSSGSINIASDVSGSPNTTLSNIGGNILISAGGMRLSGSAAFIAATGSFQYISGSMTQIGNYTQQGNYIMTGNKTITGSLRVSGSGFINNSRILTDLDTGSFQANWMASSGSSQILDVNGTNGPTTIAIGRNTGLFTPPTYGVAIGNNAGESSQGEYGVAIGNGAGQLFQGTNAVAIGSAGYEDQGQYAIAIGAGAGDTEQGQYAIAIGAGAGANHQTANSIILDATNGTIQQAAGAGLHIAPIRSGSTTSNVLNYNTTTKEITYITSSFETTGRGIISSSANLVTTSSFNSYTASISTASLVTSINNLNTFSASQYLSNSYFATTASLNTLSSSLTTISSSIAIIDNTQNSRLSAIEYITASLGVNATTGSYGSFYDTTTQSGSANTAYVMKLNSYTHQNGINLSGSGAMVVSQTGVYDIEFSAQLANGPGDDILDIWLRKNGTNVEQSNTRLNILKDTKTVAAWNWVDTGNAGDYYEIMWSTNGGNITITAFNSGSAPTRPAVPSVIATIHRVDVGGITYVNSATGQLIVSASTGNALTVAGTIVLNGALNVSGTLSLTGSIIPSTDNTYDLGSSTKSFRHLYVSSGSIYMNGSKVLSSTAQELQFTTDAGQSIKILEAGTDTITLQSADGNITLASSGGGDVVLDPTNGVIGLKGTTTLYSGNKIVSSDGNAIQIGNDLAITGSLTTTTGNINGINLSNLQTTFNTFTGSSNTSLSRLNSYTSSLNTAFQITGSNVTILGNLNVAGTQSVINSTTLQIGDNIIELNGTGATNAGLLVKDATNPNTASGSLLWDSTNDYWKAGTKDSESKILLAGGDSIISGSSQVIGILSSLNTYTGSNDTKHATLATYTASLDTKFTTLANVTSSLIAATSSYETKGRGIVSGSSQIDVMSTTNIAKLATTGSNTFTGTQTINGNISLGSTNTSFVGPSQYGGIMFPRGQVLFSNTNTQNQLYLSSNAYTNASGVFAYRNTGQPATFIGQDNGAISIGVAGNGTADTAITFTTAISISNAGVTTFGGNVIPDGNGTRDLGSSSARWSTIYTSDLSLNNGIGDWTIVEGEDDLFLYNNKKGKVYKFALTEVEPNMATPKKS